MEIKINAYTIHYVEKKVKTNLALVELSNGILVVDSFSEILVSEIHKSFSENKSLKNTHFKENETNVFYNTLNKYLDEFSPARFYDFSVASILDLKERIEKEFFAIGGYYLFVDYESDSRRYQSVILLRKKSGVNIVRVGNSFRLSDAENINVEKIAMGVRLNYQIYTQQNDTRNYLAVITTQQNGEISGYFKDWVLAGGIITFEKNTTDFIKVLKAIDIPKNENGQELYTRDNFKKAVFEFVENRADKTINLLDIGNHFFGEENKTQFLDFALQHQILIDPEFKRSSYHWRGLVTIRAKVEGIELNVDNNKLNYNDVDVKDTYVIIHSQEIVNQINDQRLNVQSNGEFTTTVG